MLRFARIKNAVKTSDNAYEKQVLAQESTEARDRNIKNWYANGGSIAIAWIKKHYRMHNGEPLHWDEPFLEDFFLLFANPWVERLIICKPAQVGWTESLIALTAFFLAYLRSPLGLGFEERNKVYAMVGKRIQPAFDNCNEIQKLKRIRQDVLKREDIDSKQSITVGGSALELFYAKVQASRTDEQAASTIRSFTARAIFVDEFGLCDQGVLDVASARMEKSDWPTKITRAGSTPGMEGSSVDKEVRKSTYNFVWEVKCSECGAFQFLDAFNNFLRPVLVDEDGVSVERYVDKVGRPLSWFHESVNPGGVSDWQLTGDSKEIALSTVYVGCQKCFQKLLEPDINNGQFKCINSHVYLKELLFDSILKQQPIRHQVAMHLPKLASCSFHPETRLRFMFATDKPADGIQQFLGKATSLGGGKINLSRLVAGQSIVVPSKKHNLRIAGIDQGRSAYWVLIANWWWGEDSSDKTSRWKNSHKEIIWHGEISSIEDLDYLTKEYDLDLIGLDQEPEYNAAVDYGLKHLPVSSGSKQTKGQVFLFDQMNLNGEQFRRTIRVRRDTKQKRRDDIKIPIYLLDRTFGLDAVRDRIYRGLQTFPQHLKYNPKDKSNLFYHYLTSDRTNDGTWSEIPGAPDHLFHCDSFIEGAALAHLYEPGMGRMTFSSMPLEDMHG